MFCFSFPPRRICLRVHREGPERTTCFPRLVRDVSDELCQRYGLSLSDLTYLPRGIFFYSVYSVTSFAAPRCLDLKTIEDISGRKHGRVFVASATRKLIAEKSDWLDVGPWELTVSKPVPIGYSSQKINIRIFQFKDRDNKETNDCSILALTCSVCKFENTTHATSTYEFVRQI